jgi:beta-galactosidase
MRSIINFNENWAFTKSVFENLPTEVTADFESVNLPHTWNATDGQDGGNDYYRGTCLYAKTLLKSELPVADKYYLEINGANSSATVYLTGVELATHDGGYSTWRVDLTNGLKEENFIIVSVDNAPNNRVYPQVADFTFYGGLYRNVNIIAVSNSHFDLDYFGGKGLVVTPIVEGANANVNAKTYITNKVDGQKVKYVITNKEGEVVCETICDDEANFTIETSSPITDQVIVRIDNKNYTAILVYLFSVNISCLIISSIILTAFSKLSFFRT